MKSRDGRRSVDASTESAFVNASASNAITTTATTGHTTFWNAEFGVGTSSLALEAARAKNGPPVSHETIDIDVDNEVHGEDDYMSPPDVSGNKRRMITRTNSKSTLVPP
jgi:hypothetical protein